MLKKLNKIAKDTNHYLLKYLQGQNNSELIIPMKYGLLPGGKKIRSKVLIDVGRIFRINYNEKVNKLITYVEKIEIRKNNIKC